MPRPLNWYEVGGNPLLALATMTASGTLETVTEPRSTPGTNGHQATLESEPTQSSGDPASESPSAGRVRWQGVIGVEGEVTGDGRLIEKNALRWENFPLPLRYVSSDVGMHDGAVVVGQIESISRGDSGQILGEGTLDNVSTFGIEAIRQVEEELTNGVSMDLDDVSFEIRIAAELLEDDEGGIMGMPLFLAAQHAKEDEDDDETPADDPFEPDEDGRITVAEMNSDDEVRVTTDGRIRAATIVAIPAFASAKIHLVAESTPEAAVDTDDQGTNAINPAAQIKWARDYIVNKYGRSGGEKGLVAGAAPTMPPRGWFTDPKLKEPTALVVTEQGQVYGHIATWDTCHITHTQQGKCIQPPHSLAGYRYFRTGVVETTEGEVAVGHLTLDTRHAGAQLTAASACSHYEDTGTVIADVNVGEDSHGIWVAGSIRPTATAKQLRSLKSS